MSMYDYNLKFDSEAQAKIILQPLLSGLQADRDYAIEYGLVLTTKTGNIITTDNGFTYPETKIIDGYFVMLRSRTKLEINNRFMTDNAQASFLGKANYINDNDIKN